MSAEIFSAKRGLIMRFFLNFIKSTIRMAVGACILLVSAAIPVYFISVDKVAVVAAGNGTATPEDVARIYLDNAKLTTAILISDCAGLKSDVGNQARALFEKHPNWIPAGGDEPFFEAFYSTISSRPAASEPFYNILALSDNRKKLLEFLNQTQTGLVRKFVELRSLNSTLLPPVFTSAGAPLEAALLTSALLAKTGDFNPSFQKDLSITLEKMKGDSAKKDEFERYCLALLVFEKDMDWTQIRSLIPHYNSLVQIYDFAKVYNAAPDVESKKILLASLMVCGDTDACRNYLLNADIDRWADLKFAFLNGEGSLKFLLDQGKPIYKDSWLVKRLSEICDPLRIKLGPFAASNPVWALILKVVLSVLGGYFFIRGFLRIFSSRRDTPSWHSPLALLRGFIEAVVVAAVFLSFLEPDTLNVKIENGQTPELRFAFEKIVNNIEKDTMNFQTDSATLAAIGIFLIIQFLVYVICVIRLAAIKRTKVPAKLKLRLLENEDNLFDLGLYIGLTGTVFSLILLSLGIFNASLMAGYSSTLFGIIFTAIVKVVHLRSYKRKLLIEEAKENG